MFNPNPTSPVVGYTTIPDGVDFRYDISETAARYEAVRLIPGQMSVFAGNDRYGAANLFVVAEAKVTARNDGAYFFGVAMGSDPQHERHPDVGKIRTVHYPVSPDTVVWNDDAYSILAWDWRQYARGININGYGLEVHTYKTLVHIMKGLRRESNMRIDPLNGELAEFVSTPSVLVERVNDLQADGFDPDVWRVSFNDRGEPWFETPFEDHRPYGNERKYQPSYSYKSDPREHWRYYQDAPTVMGRV